ncbi:MAG: cell wall-binding protein [Gemella haemolysans]|uniref:cell wall-binding protein n=1 Tax=Gemella haemolysans TaxID=1379 RepID=UPI002907DD60|nr:cell wall-binding protein [Gemella haemolysans]MDU6573551.1 cell wall-binding protein [Gemella haemolysans]
MKSKLLFTVLLSVSVILSGCSLFKSDLISQNKAATSKNENSKDKVYGLNEEWIVDGQWRLKITEVKTTQDRNKHIKDKIAQVVIIKYTYENLGFKNEYQDLFLAPRTVIDGAENEARIYPVNSSKYPEPTPVGAISESAMGYGLSVESDKIKISFTQFDKDGKKMENATFEVPVTK